MKRRRIDSASAVPSRNAVANLMNSSYCCSMMSQLIGRVRIGWRLAYLSGSPFVRPVEPLFLEVLQSRQKGKSQQMAERKAHFALPVRIHILLLHIHLGVVAQHALRSWPTLLMKTAT